MLFALVGMAGVLLTNRRNVAASPSDQGGSSRWRWRIGDRLMAFGPSTFGSTMDAPTFGARFLRQFRLLGGSTKEWPSRGSMLQLTLIEARSASW